MKIEIQSENLRTHLQRLVGERHPSGSPDRLAAAETYVAGQLSTYGFTVTRDPVPFGGAIYHNVAGSLRPVEVGPFLLIGAHFDSVPGSPGADDNASGVAVLLEVARVISLIAPSCAVQFVAYTLEEEGMVGSTVHAIRLKQAHTKLIGMISLEMVGYINRTAGAQRYPPGLSWFYPPTGDFIAVIGNLRSRRWLRQVTRTMRSVPSLSVETLCLPGNGRLVPAVRLSDHAPFWDLGYPALLVTDTSFYRNPHYHLASDTLATLDLSFMAGVAQGIVHTVQSCQPPFVL